MGAAVKDGDQDSKEEKLELLELEKALELAEEGVLRDKPEGRVAGVDCLTGEDGCLGACFEEPVSSIR